MDDDVLSFIMGSTRRQEVLLLLYQNKMTVGQLAHTLRADSSMMYRIVRELTDRELITHNNVSRYKIYRITDKGIELLKFMDVIK